MSEHRRRLAAILFVDIVGYTDRSHRDEQGALAAREWVTEIIRHRALSRGGRIVKILGDGALLEFVSAVEAVSAAIEIQEDVRLRESGLSDPVQVRAGVHVGEVVDDAGDVLGNAVNIASRVQAMSRPGGICITREVYAHIRPILRLRCKRVQVSEKHRLPDTVEVLEIDERHGATSTTLNAVRRKSSPWPIALLVGALSLITVASLAYGLGWIGPPRADLPVGQPISAPVEDLAKNAERSSKPNPEPNSAEPAKGGGGVKPSGEVRSIEEAIEPIPFQTVVRQNAELAAGQSNTIIAGQNGVRRVKYEIVRANGKLVSRRIVESSVVTAPIQKVIERGTKVRPKPAPTNSEKPPVKSQDDSPKPWICPQCGERRSPDQDFCPEDGSRRPGG